MTSYEILTAYVGKLRDIPELVAEVEDAENIVAFVRRFPDLTYLRKWAQEQTGPKIIWAQLSKRVAPSSSGDNYVHTFGCVLVPPPEETASEAPWTDRVHHLMEKGIPASGGGRPMEEVQPLEGVSPPQNLELEWIEVEEPGMDVARLTVTFFEF